MLAKEREIALLQKELQEVDLVLSRMDAGSMDVKDQQQKLPQATKPEVKARAVSSIQGEIIPSICRLCFITIVSRVLWEGKQPKVWTLTCGELWGRLDSP